jgi:hypothetical protein
LWNIFAEKWRNDSSDTSKNDPIRSNVQITKTKTREKRRITSYPVSNMAGLSYDAQDNKPPEFKLVDVPSLGLIGLKTGNVY